MKRSEIVSEEALERATNDDAVQCLESTVTDISIVVVNSVFGGETLMGWDDQIVKICTLGVIAGDESHY